MTEAVKVREAGTGDLPFLFALYCDVRGPEVSAWGWPAPQCDAFLRMQFDARQRSYLAAYPQAADQIISSHGENIGRRLTAVTPGGMCLVDIALLAAYRNQGIGTQLIRQLMEDCDATGRMLRLQVLRGNPAQRLYHRLGFRETDSDAEAIYIEMTRAPEPRR
jgi:ribosomal protein S18 acetylase RimI-like enzyme